MNARRLSVRLLPTTGLSPRALLAAFGLALLLGGCASPPPAYDYSAFRVSKPASLLVLPPLNDTPDIKATPGVLATATLPLAEAGYYVLPVTLVDETFRQNGLTSPNDIQAVSITKLREIFGADAAVYLRVRQYGTSYRVLGSETRVTVDGRIVDLRSGQMLWAGSATASSQENQNNSQGVLGLLVTALVHQVIGNLSDASFDYAGIANQRLLGSPRANGVLAGPRSPRYGQDPQGAQ
jgi:hypothetical protein